MSTKPFTTSLSVAGGPRAGGARGFTLLEVMIVVAIVAVLSAIALPNYADYIKRGKIIEATSGLSDMRTRYEQWYLDKRTYAGGCLAFGGTVAATVRAFTLDCSTEGALNYTTTATGNAAEGMTGFVYSIKEGNVHATTNAWGQSSTTCWIVRKDGSCS